MDAASKGKTMMPKNEQKDPVNRLNLTEKTLAQQLQISDREIEERKSLMLLCDKDVRILRECKPLISRHLDEIVNEFYSHQTTIPEIELLIGDAETFKRLHASMRGYISELFDGYYDRDYVNKRLRIGKVHKRIGVSPKLYISAISLLETILLSKIEPHFKSRQDCEPCTAYRDSLHRILMFDVQLVFDTYINSLVTEVASAKEEIEKYAAGLEATVEERTQQLHELSIRDQLTGLFNQHAFYQRLRHELIRSEADRAPLTLVYMDLNSFKQLNDTRGHLAGDNLLALVGSTIRREVRDNDIPCRYGGDEFCILMPDTEANTAVNICQRLTENFAQQENHGITFSIGISQAGPESYPDMDRFVRTADGAMYESKAKARKKAGDYITIAAD
jgi:diguanylate cyclase (GGDEF)-like protein